MEKNIKSKNRFNKTYIKIKTKGDMKKIKVIQIAHVSHSFFLSEKERDLRKLILSDWYFRTAQQLKKFHPEIEIECWCPERLYKNEVNFVESGIKFRIFPTAFSPIYGLDFSFKMLKEMKKEVKEAEQESYRLVFHLHEYHNLHGLLIASFFKAQRIIGQHHGGSWPMKHLAESRKKRWFFPFFILGQIWENRVLKNINYFYALSQDELDYLKGLGLGSRARFQTMGIEDACFKKLDKKTARRRLGLKLNKKIILYIGRINEEKGVRHLLDAMNGFQDFGDLEIELKIIGFGPQEKEFQNYAEKLKLKNTEFLGSVFGEKKLVYLSAADVLVLPSSKEGAPVIVMEAMARNLPVVVSDVGGTPLMIKKGEDGIIIKQKSSEDIIRGMKEVLSWKDKDIRKYAKIYKWKKIIDDTVEDYGA